MQAKSFNLYLFLHYVLQEIHTVFKLNSSNTEYSGSMNYKYLKPDTSKDSLKISLIFLGTF